MFFMFLLLSMSLATLVVPSVRNVVIVGGGAAGLSSAIEALRKGANVTLLEKTPKIGGNSAKASSGISAAYTTVQQQHHISDSVHNFLEDTTKTGLELGDKEMVSTLVSNSAGAIEFLLNELKLPITELLQLGGHSAKRTHRLTTHAPIGFSLVKSLEKKVADMVANEEGGTFQLLSSATVIHLETADDHTVEVIYTNEGEELRLKADAVVMTSGGMSFGRDLLTEYAPHLVGHATSSGPQADGSGIRILRDLGAKLVDMDKVQVHPTGFVDPKNPGSVSKILAPEALRGCGGILVNSAGNRFVDELTRRGVVTAFIEQYGDHSQPVLESGRPQATVSMILNQRVVDRFGQKLFNFYLGRGIFREYANIEELCEKESINHSALQNTLREYSQMATASDFGVNVDPFGKTVFPVPIDGTETLFVATITPVMHYNMGGIKITPNAEVIKHVENDDEDGTPSVISGLYAAGECTGGVHGGDRLAGNSLLDCVVFGRIAGMQAATSTTAVVKETESYNQEL